MDISVLNQILKYTDHSSRLYFDLNRVKNISLHKLIFENSKNSDKLGKNCKYRNLNELEKIPEFSLLNIGHPNENLIKKLNKLNFLKVRILNLSYMEMRMRDILYISLCHFSSIQILSLEGNDLDDKSLYSLIYLEFYSLETLNLNKNKITNDFIKVISLCKFKNLKKLKLRKTLVTYTEEEIIELVKFDNLKIVEVGVAKYDQKIQKNSNIMLEKDNYYDINNISEDELRSNNFMNIDLDDSITNYYNFKDNNDDYLIRDINYHNHDNPNDDDNEQNDDDDD